jgi:hypothetical protein
VVKSTKWAWNGGPHTVFKGGQPGQTNQNQIGQQEDPIKKSDLAIFSFLVTAELIAPPYQSLSTM